MLGIEEKLLALFENAMKQKKFNYNLQDLGNNKLFYESNKILRHDLEIISADGNMIFLSLFSPEKSECSDLYAGGGGAACCR